jgi:hypothetical protein
MGKRFAIVIGMAAAGVMALGAQTAAVPSDVVKYGTKLTIAMEGHRGLDGGHLFHGGVESEVKKCMDGRRVVLFNRQPGADRKLGTARSEGTKWGIPGIRGARHWYAKVRREVTPWFVCQKDRTATKPLTK